MKLDTVFGFLLLAISGSSSALAMDLARHHLHRSAFIGVAIAVLSFAMGTFLFFAVLKTGVR
jgi:hypothetical protein